MKTVQIKAENRENIGTTGSKQTRNAGRIPAVVYGGGQANHVSVLESEVKHIIYTPDFKTAEIEIDGEVYPCILKDIQAHPLTDEILHLDFLRLVEDHPVNVEIPVRFKGTSPGVKAGGALMQSMRKVKIKTTPEHLVDELLLDISGLQLGQSVRVKDIEVNEHIQLMNSPNTPIATVEIPRALKSAASAESKAAAGAEEGPAEEAAEE